MYAQSLRVDNIANNLANTNTTGFKKGRIEFQDLFYETLRPAGVSDQQNTQLPTELQIGHGSRPVANIKNFMQGEIVQTENTLDMAMEGVGFFQVTKPDGNIAYTRDGNFHMSSDGQLVTASGLSLQPAISIPEDAIEINIGVDGIVSVVFSGDPTPQEVGQIELAKFVNPGGLKNVGGNLFEATSASGDPLLGNPGVEGFGKLLQGYLEKSNVNVVNEMVGLIVAQRAFEVNSKAIRTAEQMMEIANGIKR
jgi:flagellar basal-body rod protein FlgG